MSEVPDWLKAWLTSEHEDDDLLIPKSLVVEIINERIGANCQTYEEMVAYLKEHPESKYWLELDDDSPIH